MADHLEAVKAQDAPEPGIPPSQKTVKVSIIDSTTRVSNISSDVFLKPKSSSISPFKMSVPAYSFLIENETKGQAVLYDLAVAKNWLTLYPPQHAERLRNMLNWDVTIEKDVIDILEDHGFDPAAINAVIWSHHHFDHVGDVTRFPPSTSLVVGPGFKSNFVPGWPTDPQGDVAESAWQGRELQEVKFGSDANGLTIGGYKAFDYFDDGSFYLLDCPGHAIGHICGLARTTADPPSFIFMGGDTCHHGSVFRPTEYLPLPKEISPHPIRPMEADVQGLCPGEIFQKLQSNGSATEPFSDVAMGYDIEECRQSVRKMEGFDAHENIFSVIAHDASLLDVLDFYPQNANSWMAQKWKQKGLWRFLGDLLSEEEKEKLIK